MPFRACPIPGFADPFSSITHLAGAAVFACLTPLLLRRGGAGPLRVASLAVFAFCTVLVLATSGAFHLLPHGTAARELLRRLDHAAIFALIAGTSTPTHVVLFRGAWRWAPLLVVWAAALAGAVFKLAFFRDSPEWLGLTFYLVLGWFGVVGGAELYRRHGLGLVLPLAWGGLAYTAGAVLEFLHWPVVVAGVVGPHELFHVLVLLGAGLHWRFVWSFADGTVPPPLVGPEGPAAAPPSAPSHGLAGQ